MMKLTINGEPQEVDATHLSALVQALGYDEDVIATALNADFVPRIARPYTQLSDGDAVEILSPMQGG